MKKCVRIIFSSNVPVNVLHKSIKASATQLTIEGSARVLVAEKKIELLACGKKDAIDAFIDVVHRELSRADIYDIEVEPFLKLKDYRGVFRIIE